MQVRTIPIIAVLALGAMLVSCSTGKRSADSASRAGASPEAFSLLGTPLYPMPQSSAARRKNEKNLARARRDFSRDPTNEDAIIWLGRRTAYLGRYQDAIDIYTDGLAIHPDSYKLLRHRGHRFITTRQLDRAIDDLSRAALLIEGVPDEVEPDGMPNASNTPTSTNHTNIDYHLGLAHYLKGEFADALGAYRRCLAYSKNDDMRCATLYWLHLTQRRLGDEAEAMAALDAVTPEMSILENVGYHRLLLFYRGDIDEDALLAASRSDDEWEAIDDATIAYGLAVWHMLEGDRDEAVDLFRRLVEGPAWPAFGHIAAEAELARGAFD